jgi:hypothetical protein
MKTRAILAALLLTFVLAAPQGAPNIGSQLSGTPLTRAGTTSALPGAPHGPLNGRISDEEPGRPATERPLVGGAPSPVAAQQLVVGTSGPSAPATSGIGTALMGGTLSYVDPSYGPLYLALPFPRGTVATVCGPADCVLRRSTDFGPDQRIHPDRIADLSARDWMVVCGQPLSAGLCAGTVELEPPIAPADDRMRIEDGGPVFTLPPTDTRSE